MSNATASDFLLSFSGLEVIWKPLLECVCNSVAKQRNSLNFWLLRIWYQKNVFTILFGYVRNPSKNSTCHDDRMMQWPPYDNTIWRMFSSRWIQLHFRNGIEADVSNEFENNENKGVIVPNSSRKFPSIQVVCWFLDGIATLDCRCLLSTMSLSQQSYPCWLSLLLNPQIDQSNWNLIDKLFSFG